MSFCHGSLFDSPEPYWHRWGRPIQRLGVTENMSELAAKGIKEYLRGQNSCRPARKVPRRESEWSQAARARNPRAPTLAGCGGMSSSQEESGSYSGTSLGPPGTRIAPRHLRSLDIRGNKLHSDASARSGSYRLPSRRRCRIPWSDKRRTHSLSLLRQQRSEFHRRERLLGICDHAS